MRALGILLVMATLTLPAQRSAAQAQQRCFAQTGQCISGRFRQFWEQTGGLAVFGFPISAASDVVSQDSGQTSLVQWFERSRFELHPENAAPFDVVLERLGDTRLKQLGHRWQTFPKQAATEPHYFAATGHAIDYGPFWSFWSTHGIELDGRPGTSAAESIALFGLPISHAVSTTNADGDLVLAQWFERARLEYHPNNPEPYTVLLGLVGTAVQRNQRESAAEATAPADPGAEPVANRVQVLRQGFGQSGQRVGYSFVLHNDQDRVAERVTYQVSLLDAAGALVGSDAHFLEIMYPNETLGVGDEIVVEPGLAVARIEVLIDGARMGSTMFADFDTNPLSVERSSYRSDGSGVTVSGTIRNRLTGAVDDIRVDAVVYDDNDTIIGGGFVYADVLPASGTAEVQIIVTAAGVPARVELYPSLTDASDIGQSQDDES